MLAISSGRGVSVTRPVHVSTMADVVAKRLARLGVVPPAAPVRSQVLADIEAGVRRQHAEALRRQSMPQVTVLRNGRVVVSVPVPMLRPGEYPDEWLD